MRATTAKQPAKPTTERLEARVPTPIKDLIGRAASLEGVSLTDFVIATLQKSAAEVVREHGFEILLGVLRMPASSRSNSTKTWRNAVTSSFFAPPLVIGLIRRNSPSFVLKTRSIPPFAATLDFHSEAVSVTPRGGAISPSSFSAAGAMATNSSG